MNAVAETTLVGSPAGKAAWITLAVAWMCFLIPFPGFGLFLGWPLNLAAFMLAIVAMSTGGAMKGLLQLMGSLIVSPVVYFIGLAIFAAAIDALSQLNRAQMEASANGNEVTAAVEATVPVSSAQEVSSATPLQNYQDSEIAADDE